MESEWINFASIKMYDWAEIIDYDLKKFNQQYWDAINFLENKLDLLDRNYWFEVSVVSECVKWEWFGVISFMNILSW